MRTSEVLNRAADQIQVRGLWQGDEGEGTCMANAIYDAAGQQYGVSNPARVAVANHLGLVDNVLDAIFVWNDAPGRTAAEVIEVLRATAVIEAARESQLSGVTA